MLESKIYVGLRDKDSHEQIRETEEYKTILKGICKSYQTPFSLHVMEGGYYHDDGTWVDENTLVVTLLGIPRQTVYKIARELCEVFHQESVIITGSKIIHFDVHDGEKPKGNSRSDPKIE